MDHDIQIFAEYSVTPFVGVWIETGGLSYDDRRTKSHPSWVCGLKQELARPSHSEPRVTPFVGVWIETLAHLRQSTKVLVTPFVGVWIETITREQAVNCSRVTPFVGVWIETFLNMLMK